MNPYAHLPKSEPRSYRIRCERIIPLAVAVILLLWLVFYGIRWFYQQKADRLNRNYGTHFTAGDVFFGVHERYKDIDLQNNQ